MEGDEKRFKENEAGREDKNEKNEIGEDGKGR